jgi:DNA-nicking Smr family endonuclease
MTSELPLAQPALSRPAPGRRIRYSALAIGVQPGGVDSATWHRFRTGKLPTTRVLDLHGHTAQRAFHALARFLHAAHAERQRCVEVVTGQGGVLKRELPLWLNQPDNRPLVLAAVHPHPANPGSVRLLLRRAP